MANAHTNINSANSKAGGAAKWGEGSHAHSEASTWEAPRSP